MRSTAGLLGALLSVLCAGLCAGTALADTTVYYRAGGWDAFSGQTADGRPVCGVGTTNPVDNRSFSMRFSTAGDGVLFQVRKPSWTIPEGAQIPVVVQVGLDAPWTWQAGGNGQLVEWSLDRGTIQAFDMQFRRANSMTVTFPTGNEPPWTVSLNGSTAISNAFGRCVTDLAARGGVQSQSLSGPTQPFAQQPTQPTQPTTPR